MMMLSGLITIYNVDIHCLPIPPQCLLQCQQCMCGCWRLGWTPDILVLGITWAFPHNTVLESFNAATGLVNQSSPVSLLLVDM